VKIKGKRRYRDFIKRGGANMRKFKKSYDAGKVNISYSSGGKMIFFKKLLAAILSILICATLPVCIFYESLRASR